MLTQLHLAIIKACNIDSVIQMNSLIQQSYYVADIPEVLSNNSINHSLVTLLLTSQTSYEDV